MPSDPAQPQSQLPARPHNRRIRLALSMATVENGVGRDGIGVYTAALAEHLPQVGVDVQGFAFGQSPGGAGRDTAPPLDSYLAYVCRDIVGLSRPLALPADVIHYTDYHIVASPLPTVATLHDAVPLKYPEWVSPRMRWAKNRIMKRMARHADQIVAVSHFAVEELVEYFGVSPDRIVVIHGGIDDQWLQPASDVMPPLHAANGRVLTDYFLMVGTFQPRKNLDNMISAYLSLPNAVRQAHPLVVVGRAGWRCGQTVERLHALERAGESVHWLQNVGSRQALRSIYQGALALSFVSLYEGFGIPVLEAFATGTPVITSTASSLPEVAGQAALLVEPQDTDAIADAMLRISSDSELRASLIEQGARRVHEFTWTHAAQKLANVYAALG